MNRLLRRLFGRARLIRVLKKDEHRDVRLYKLSWPISWSWYVVVSAADVAAQFESAGIDSNLLGAGQCQETYIFKSDRQGRILHWVELEGSYRGGLDHRRALENAGYRVLQ